jgi:hypothetical protein
MPDDDDYLTPDQRADIWDRWQARVTISNLAAEFNTTQEVIRRIIAMPRRPR